MGIFQQLLSFFQPIDAASPWVNSPIFPEPKGAEPEPTVGRAYQKGAEPEPTGGRACQKRSDSYAHNREENSRLQGIQLLKVEQQSYGSGSGSGCGYGCLDPHFLN